VIHLSVIGQELLFFVALLTEAKMGLFSQSLNRSIGSSLRPGPPKDKKRNYACDTSPLTPIKENVSLSFEGGKTKTIPLPQRRWNLLPPPKCSFATTNRDKRMMSALESDTDISISQIEDWNDENDDVTLLPPQKATNIESVLYPCDGEGFDVTSSRTQPVITPYSTQRLSSAPVVNSAKSQNLWNKVSSLKNMKNHWNQQPSAYQSKNKNRSKEIEIQFECFFEDDEYSANDEFLSSAPPTIIRDASKATLFRKTTVLQSWFTETIGAVKRGCVNSTSNNSKDKKSRPHGTSTTEPTYEYDDCDDSEGEVQIVFENVDENKSIVNSDDDMTAAFSHQAWDMDELVQFQIPNVVEPSSWEYYDSCHCKCNHGAVNKISKSVLASIV
jgi:hypothetical protein